MDSERKSRVLLLSGNAEVFQNGSERHHLNVVIACSEFYGHLISYGVFIGTLFSCLDYLCT